ncbi:MAG TPA: ornithine cyclodeaminase family protein [Anaerolineae bacterium]|nr:ornithine cyclodeaminase family protein [Anaerolineae bacterium]
MKTMILSTDDLRTIVQAVGLDALMDHLIKRLLEAFQSFDPVQTVVPLRAGFQYAEPQPGLIEWMPVMRAGEAVALKIVGYHPGNPRRHALPTILSTISAYDPANGHLIGLADATFLTALRTGAASAIASRFLAAEKASILGLIGAGAQAVTQLHALTREFELKKVLVYDADPAISDSFLERVAFLGLDIKPIGASELPHLVTTSDIICTATSVERGAGPVFQDGATKPWLHVNAGGADFPNKTEIPRSFLERSLVCPDFPEQARQEGECQYLAPAQIGPSLVEVVQQPEQFAWARQTTTVFDSTGWALEDHVALEMMLDYAAELKLGTPLQIETTSIDPYNPYQFVAETPRSAAVNGHHLFLSDGVESVTHLARRL